MKSVAVLALAAGASAQVSLYSSIAGNIVASVDALDSAIKAYTGGPGSAVLAAASALDDAVTSGSKKAAGGSDITDLNAALLLLPPYTTLVASVQKVVGDLVSSKTLAFHNGLGPSAEAALKQESVDALALAAVITGKLTGDAEIGRGIASGSIISPLTSALNSGIAAYSSGPSPTVGGGSASSAVSSAVSSAKSSASAAASSSSSVESSISSAISSAASAASSAATATSAGSVPVPVSSAPAQFTGAASGLQVGSGLAAAFGALAYLL